MESLFTSLLQSPALLGAAITLLLKTLHAWFEKFDTSGTADKLAPQLHVVFLVLSFLASVADAASKGQLGNIDLSGLQSFAQYFVTIVATGKAMAATGGIDWKSLLTGKSGASNGSTK